MSVNLRRDYVHTLKRSTIEAKTYSNTNGGTLSSDEAKQIVLASLEKIQSLNSFEKYVDMDIIKEIFKKLNISSKPYI